MLARESRDTRVMLHRLRFHMCASVRPALQRFWRRFSPLQNAAFSRINVMDCPIYLWAALICSTLLHMVDLNWSRIPFTGYDPGDLYMTPKYVRSHDTSSNPDCFDLVEVPSQRSGDGLANVGNPRSVYWTWLNAHAAHIYWAVHAPGMDPSNLIMRTNRSFCYLPYNFPYQ